MYSPIIVAEALINGLMLGAVYALVALGLTLIYGVLHIVNFAHGALLTVAMFGVWICSATLGLDPYLSILVVGPVMFGIGYSLQRYIIGPASHGSDNNILLVTLGLSIVIENVLLAVFQSDTRTISTDYAFEVIEAGPLLLSYPRVIGLGVAIVTAIALWIVLNQTRIGRAIRAVAKEKTGASLSGIDVPKIYAITFALGCTCLAVAAGLLMPTFYVNPRTGAAFVLVAFTIVVLGGMGSITGALVGGLLIGVVESASSLYLGDSLGQIGIFLIFILVLLFKPTGLFGARQ
ncbi:branched-chain amino acid ABC transporter permease [Acuticoccus sediminis]|uniref:Branched-chain amino acid ABC transporter permease n=1 Tax=Acuticoccus sediminis TaxID=2184697 RepID=A0A8B2NVV0_9HYPH|nr:branched-chain amino acid ABC transporter permease [Acuticoccus sediminis]RAI02971.1 branched-chain amino acid ABC transporter permease [Acuticoccus sediminis]